MSVFVVERLHDPSDADMAAVLNLFKKIPGRTCTAAAYLDYLHMHWVSVAVVVIRNNGKIVGFTQAVAPSQLEPQCAWLPFSCTTPECPHKQSVRAEERAIEWMKGKGATKMKYTTVRNPRKLVRVWGMKRSKEVLLEKDI